MTFKPAELRRDAVYRGDYEFVSPEKFVADGIAHCGRVNTGLVGFGVVGLGMGVALLVGRARPTILSIALLAALTGGVAVATLLIDMPHVGEPSQERAVFSAGSASAPSDREVLLDMSPTTLQARPGGIFIARILAPGPYAFVVGCDGPSIHVGESSEIENGGTGGRQLIGCSTVRPVRGTIADRSDRADIVEIVVDPNGMSDWRVVVVGGAGEVGPFDEP